jgi:phenylacetate-coenzyme A ligase PaaK-like adenylate-forming protein
MDKSIFSISDNKEFEVKSIQTFNYQYKNCTIYRQFVDGIGINSENVKTINQIPFLPISFYKTHRIISDEYSSTQNYEALFTSSTTTGAIPSKHYVAKIEYYKEAYHKAFEMFYGNPMQYAILALLPNYLEREGSSLVFMFRDLIEKSNNECSGFYPNEFEKLKHTLFQLKQKKQPTLLLGVSFALLDFADSLGNKNIGFEELTVMETGGMKGRRKELVREELHQILSLKLGVNKIHSEYGMTELLSQAYSKGNALFECPPWMKILIRDTNDPFSLLPNGRSGGINVIDLANIYSCSFIATQDLGKLHSNNTFEILGRFDNSDIRGCNLMIQ